MHYKSDQSLESMTIDDGFIKLMSTCTNLNAENNDWLTMQLKQSPWQTIGEGEGTACNVQM